MKILVIEDDKSACGSIKLGLQTHGYVVETAQSGTDGIEMAKCYDYDAIVLDVMLPDIGGDSVIRKIREYGIEAPIIVLTSKLCTKHKTDLLNNSVDDYLHKPHINEELIARIKAVIRRSKGHSTSIVRTGNIFIDTNANTVRVNNKIIHLTDKEYRILELLSMRKGITLSKEIFLNHIYGGLDEPELKIIDVFICKLRKKIADADNGQNYIHTVWGRGYVLRDPYEANMYPEDLDEQNIDHFIQ